MKIEFIIPSSRPKTLIGILGSLIAQSNDNWFAHVIFDGNYDDSNEIMDMFKSYSNIKFTTIPGPNNDWGHTPRNYGIKTSTCEWLIMTGDDNYYVPTFVQEFINTINSNKYVSFVYCDMVHNGFNYKQVICKPKAFAIDIGCYAFLKKFGDSLSLDVTKNHADGLFCELYVSKFAKAPQNTIHINKTLYVHN